jgi:hypothetical protein
MPSKPLNLITTRLMKMADTTTCDLCKKKIPESEGPYVHNSTDIHLYKYKTERTGWCCEKCWEQNFDHTGYLDKKRRGLDTRVSVLSVQVQPVKVRLIKLPREQDK